MKIRILFTCLCIAQLCLKGQTIDLYSIHNNRQISGDAGYTLNGMWMNGSSRLKLLNPANFGPTGTYPKTVLITDTFAQMGSLITAGQMPADALFFFGSFGTEPFTEAEIDSLHSWSMRGGKVIMTSAFNNSGIPSAVAPKWGFTGATSASSILPTPQAQNTDLFNGPFGAVSNVSQAGSLQGFYYKTPQDIRVLGVTPEGRPAIYLDCRTLDLLVIDTDVYTTLGWLPPNPMGPNPPNMPDRISQGPLIQNMQDKFLANTLVFMDRLQSPPVLAKNGDQLSVNTSYLNYQWYRNGVAVGSAVSNIYDMPGPGDYYVEVEVNGGCRVKSNPFTLVLPDTFPKTDTLKLHDPDCEIFVPTAFSPDNNAVNDKACVYASCLEKIEFRLFDRWGELIFEANDQNTCWDGTYKGKKANTGVYAWTLRATKTSGNTIDKKGNITLIR